MDYGMQNYLKIINESEHMEVDNTVEERSKLRESIDSMDLFEDNDLNRADMAKQMTVNEEDIDSLFEILKQNKNPQDTLKALDDELVTNGVETISPEGSDEVIHYLRNGELYKHTIIYYNGNYYFGSVGSLLESDFDLNRLIRIK